MTMLQSVTRELESGQCERSANPYVLLHELPMRLAGALIAAGMILPAIQGAQSVASGRESALIVGLIKLLVAAVVIRIGVGLVRREKAAFWGWCFLACLGSLFLVGAVTGSVSSHLRSVGIYSASEVSAVMQLALACWLSCYALPIAWTALSWHGIRWA